MKRLLLILFLLYGCSSNETVDTVIQPENNFAMVTEGVDYVMTFSEDLDWILERCDKEDGVLNEIAYWEPDEYGVYYRENENTIVCNCAIGIECLILVIPQ